MTPPIRALRPGNQPPSKMLRWRTWHPPSGMKRSSRRTVLHARVTNAPVGEALTTGSALACCLVFSGLIHRELLPMTHREKLIRVASAFYPQCCVVFTSTHGVKVLRNASSSAQVDLLVLRGNLLAWILSSAGLGVDSLVVVEDCESSCCAGVGRARIIITCSGHFVPLTPVLNPLDPALVLGLHPVCRTI